MRRVGVFGGTFDPPHVGHLAASRAARRVARLDEMWWVPAGRPWQKEGLGPLTPAEQRYEMTRLTTVGEPLTRTSRIEVDRPGPTFAVDTLDALAAPDRQLVLVLGEDTAARIDTWRDAGRVCELADLAVVTRTQGPSGRMPATLPAHARVVTVEMEPVDVSATDIRRRIAAGESVTGMIVPAVEAYIREHGLYGAGDVT